LSDCDDDVVDDRSDDNDEDGDDDVDEDDSAEIDVDDERSSMLKPTSDRSMCPLGALLRMASQTNFESAGNGLQDCFADDSDSASCNYDDATTASAAAAAAAHSRRHHLLTSSSVAKCFRSCKKRRKTRTAFTNQQIAELELRFGRQKYLTPADRDEIAAALHLSSAQVITWFQNRRAKLKRDLEELKADVAAAKAVGNEPSSAVLDRLAELTRASGLQSASGGSSTASAKKDTSKAAGRGR
jgi:homeobox protein LBX